MGRCRLATSLAIALLIALTIHSIDPSTPANALPNAVDLSVSVSITPDTLMANVTSSQMGAVEFQGNVTVGKLPATVQRVTVTLSTNGVWPTIATPSEMEFTTDEPQAFTLNVVVPSNTTVTSEEVTVTARAVGGLQSAEGSASCTVVVGQFFRFQLDMETPYVVVDDRTPTVEGVLRIFNAGNGRDTFRVEVDDPPEALADWDIAETVTAESWTIAEVEFTLFIEFDSGPLVGADTRIFFKVTSLGAAAQGVEYSQSYGGTVVLPSAEARLEDDWPIYVGWGVGLGVLGAIAVVMVRRRRARRDRLER